MNQNINLKIQEAVLMPNKINGKKSTKDVSTSNVWILKKKKILKAAKGKRHPPYLRRKDLKIKWQYINDTDTPNTCEQMKSSSHDISIKQC